ncbi:MULTISPECIES: DUF2125 domain-containing protein [unclassified Acidisoma]|jgi:hypothetical protein|uniref:DUF2125 domain-containing protein n=1 Tax=unclassified Acidisoma TaxID=2634065 RepID=UPI00131E993F|nr:MULTISPECIES: DUF2125 domain-containing protein [unclassified Acidisoma]
MRRRRPLRRVLAGLILLVLLAVAGWTGAWLWVADRMNTHLAAWEAEQRSAGWTIAHGTPTRAGWPFAAALILPDLNIVGPQNMVPGGITWTADRLTLALDIRHPDDLYLAATGRQTLAIAGSGPIPFAAERLVAHAALQPGGAPTAATFRARQLLAAFPNAAATPSSLAIADMVGTLSVDRSAGRDRAAIAMLVSASDIDLPEKNGLGLGRRVAALAGAVGISGPTAMPGGAPMTLAAWRDSGGSLDLRLLRLDYGPLAASGEGQISLGATLQPEGTARLHATGVDAAIEYLIHSHVLKRPAATALRAMLGLLISPSASATPSALNVPLTLKSGAVSLGSVPVLRVPWLTGSGD